MAPYSSTLAWKTPWTEEPCRLQSMGSQRVGHDWVTSLTQPKYFFFFQEKRCTKYWTGQKVHLSSSVTAYGKIQEIFLANPNNFYCCIASYPLNQWFKTASIHYLTVSVGQECGRTSAWRSLTQLKRGRTCFQAQSHGIWQTGKDSLPSSPAWCLAKFLPGYG